MCVHSVIHVRKIMNTKPISKYHKISKSKMIKVQIFVVMGCVVVTVVSLLCDLWLWSSPVLSFSSCVGPTTEEKNYQFLASLVYKLHSNLNSFTLLQDSSIQLMCVA